MIDSMNINQSAVQAAIKAYIALNEDEREVFRAVMPFLAIEAKRGRGRPRKINAQGDRYRGSLPVDMSTIQEQAAAVAK